MWGMSRIRVGITIDASPDEVWDTIENIPSHVDWMQDAVAIRMKGRRRWGKGTRFECDTRFGPLAVTDEMEITEWKPRRSMGVRHMGTVTGEGRFTLRRRSGGRTRFTWTESLRFPLWLGGPVGAAAGAPVMRLVWRRNLRNLRDIVESRATVR
jgi:uncharacterized membrane protein